MTFPTRLPVVFIPHGGGPWPLLALEFAPEDERLPLRDYLRSIRALAVPGTRAVVIISAHWEQPAPTIMTAEHPPLLFDYGGFPDDAYNLTWPAPGHPAIASRVGDLLRAAGIAVATDDQRGYDHGTFVPMKVIWPAAEMPMVQLSLERGLDAAKHLAIGRALAPLRDEGVLIVGSGNSFHNLGAIRSSPAAALASSLPFGAWLDGTITLEPAARDRGLEQWSAAPGARLAHPREEHLLPLMVVAGAAGDDRGRIAFRGSAFGSQVSGYQFG